MPSGLLSVPHYRQEFDYSCVAACVRMVLAHYGVLRAEADLRSLLGTTDKGASMRSVLNVASLGFDVRLEQAEFVELYGALASNVPPIVFLETGPLDYWRSACSHVVVLVGMDATSVYLNDPFFDAAPQQTSPATFLQAWSLNDRYAVLITPRP